MHKAAKPTRDGCFIEFSTRKLTRLYIYSIMWIKILMIF